MKTKKWVLIGACILSLISLAVIILSHVGIIADSLFYDIGLAIFGSGVLAFFVALIEYSNERRKAMETFYQETNRLIHILGQVKFLSFDEPLETVKACLAEEYRNLEWGKYDETKIVHTARNELKQQFIASYPQWDDWDEEDLDKWYDDRISTYLSTIHAAMDSYIEISKTDLSSLDNAYGNLDFLFRNKHIRNELAYERLYKKIREAILFAKEKAFHFTIYKEAENGNLPVNFSFLMEFMDKWFKTKVSDNGTFFTTYNELFDELRNSNEEFRCKIYHSKFEPMEPIPVLGRMREK